MTHQRRLTSGLNILDHKIDVAPYNLSYQSVESVKTPDGDLVLRHGQPVYRKVAEVHRRIRVKNPRFLVRVGGEDAEWISLHTLYRLYSKREVRRAMRDYIKSKG